jgi:hypothetical protein
MKINLHRLLIVAVILFLHGSAYGLDYMGPPVAGLKKGQFKTGFDFALSEMDLEVKASGITGKLRDVETSRYLWNLTYGLADWWEAFVRLGAGDTEASGGFDGDTEFAYGVGTKVTLAGDKTLNWGALFQIGWGQSEGDYAQDLGFLIPVSGDAELDWYEIQIAAGPTYDMEDWRLYGGVFLHYVEGDFEVESDIVPFTFKLDVRQESVGGAYLGGRFDLRKNVTLDTEFQVTSDAWAFGLGLAYKF